MSGWSERFGGAALVTGGSSGIGAAFARALASRGFDLILVARREERLEALAEELRTTCSVRTLVVAADLTDPDSTSRVKCRVDEAGMSVGLLVNNAGVGAYGPFAEMDQEQLAALVELNCRSPQALTGAFLPGMLERGRGGVIFVASMAALQPVPYLASYAASKAFTLSLAQALWAELSPRGVAVLGLAPGYVATGFQDAAGVDERTRHGATFSAEEVVEAALSALGRTHSLVPGARNGLLGWMGRVLPRTLVLGWSAHLFDPEKDVARSAPAPRRPPVGESPAFRRLVARMVLSFLLVGLIDLTAGSLLVGRLRFWFPQWLDADWASRSDPWVVYSQSYIAGILFVPMLAWALWREVVAPRVSHWPRLLFWPAAAALTGFLVVWKGDLMRDYGKEREAVAWLVLTAILFGGLTLAEGMSRQAERSSHRSLFVALGAGVGGFFLVMAVLDPFLQIAVQGLGWSSGLMVEVAFFVPAGALLVWLSRRLALVGPGS